MRLFLIGVLAVIAGGCVRTINPVLLDSQVIADNSLAGTWVSKDKADGKQSTLVVQPPGADKKFAAVFTDTDGKKSKLVGRIGHVGDLEVVEITADPADIDAVGDYAKGLLLPLYFPMVIHPIDAKHISAEAIDPDWMTKDLADHPDELQTVKPGGKDDEEVISSSTEDFQKFLLKHFKDDGATEKSDWERSGPATQPAAGG